MNNLKFDEKNGNLFINDIAIAPFNKRDFIAIANSKNIRYSSHIPNKGWKNLSLDITINGKFFGMNMPYEGEILTQIWLSWNGGNSKIKGYNTSEQELISDKNSLTILLTKILSRLPDEKNYTNDVFLFEWGLISTSASVVSTIATIGIVWDKK